MSPCTPFISYIELKTRQWRDTDKICGPHSNLKKGHILKISNLLLTKIYICRRRRGLNPSYHRTILYTLVYFHAWTQTRVFYFFFPRSSYNYAILLLEKYFIPIEIQSITNLTSLHGNLHQPKISISKLIKKLQRLCSSQKHN